MPVNFIKGKQGEGSEKVEYSDNSTKEKVYKNIGPEAKGEDLGHVGYSAGVTVPNVMGPYSSVRITVDCRIPSTADDMDASFGFARAWVEERLIDICGTMKEEYPVMVGATYPPSEEV